MHMLTITKLPPKNELDMIFHPTAWQKQCLLILNVGNNVGRWTVKYKLQFYPVGHFDSILKTLNWAFL